MKALSFSIFGGTILLLIGSGAALGQSSPALPADYQVLAHKSIFARDRMTRAGNMEVPSGPTTAQPDIPVFIGALRWGRTPVALLEWPQSGTVREVLVPEVVPGKAGGVITRITLETLEIIGPGGPARRVKLGENLQGATPVMAALATASASAPSTPSVTSGSSSDSAIIQMLRRRRQQELK